MARSGVPYISRLRLNNYLQRVGFITRRNVLIPGKGNGQVVSATIVSE